MRFYAIFSAYYVKIQLKRGYSPWHDPFKLSMRFLLPGILHRHPALRLLSCMMVRLYTHTAMEWQIWNMQFQSPRNPSSTSHLFPNTLRSTLFCNLRRKANFRSPTTFALTCQRCQFIVRL